MVGALGPECLSPYYFRAGCFRLSPTHTCVTRVVLANRVAVAWREANVVRQSYVQFRRRVCCSRSLLQSAAAVADVFAGAQFSGSRRLQSRTCLQAHSSEAYSIQPILLKLESLRALVGAHLSHRTVRVVVYGHGMAWS